MPARKKPTPKKPAAKKAAPKKSAPKVDPKVAERKDRFGRIFPPRAEKLVKGLELLENCSNKSSYEWNTDLVQRAWIEIAKKLIRGARAFGLELEVTLNGKDVRDVDTTKRLKK